MKKLIVSLLSAALAGIMFAVPAVGQSQSLFYGEYHNYSVSFKENGESVVFARLVFTNSSDQAQSTYSFTAEKDSLKELTVLQVKLPQECAEYTQVYDYTKGTNKCARYRDPDYNSYYYYSYGSTEEITYKSATVSNDGLKYTISLPEKVDKDKTSALLMAYTSKKYTSNNFLAKSYNFPTLKIDNRITETKIGVSVDDGLVLEGANEQNYCAMGMCPISVKDSSMSSLSSDTISSSPVTSRNLDNLYASIGSGQKSYNAKSVAPGDSFIAKGRYATSELALNARSLTLILFGALLIFLAVTVYSLKINKKYGRKNPSKSTGSKWGEIRLLGSLVPLVSLLPMSTLIGATWYLSTNSFTNDVWNKLSSAGKPLLIVFIVIMYGLLVSVVPVAYGIKRGWKALISIIIMQTIWATVLLTFILPIMIFG